jgi:hypothetical protein
MKTHPHQKVNLSFNYPKLKTVKIAKANPSPTLLTDGGNQQEIAAIS